MPPWDKYRAMAMQKPLTDDEHFANANLLYNKEPMIGAAYALSKLYLLRVQEMSQYKYEKEFPMPEPYNKILITRTGPRVSSFWSNETADGSEIILGSFIRNRKGKPKFSQLLEKYGEDYEKIYKILYDRLKPDPAEAVPILIINKGVPTPDYKFFEILKKYIFEHLPKIHNLDLELEVDKNKWLKLELFPVPRYYLENKLLKYLPDFNWHQLRKSRATQLSQEMNFSVRDLQFFGKWKSPVTPALYVQADRWSILKRMADFANDKENEEQEQRAE